MGANVVPCCAHWSFNVARQKFCTELRAVVKATHLRMLLQHVIVQANRDTYSAYLLLRSLITTLGSLLVY